MEKVRCPECNAFKNTDERCSNCRSNDRYRKLGVAITERCRSCLAITKLKHSGTCARCLREAGLRECSLCHEVSVTLLEFKNKQSRCRKCRHPLRHLTKRQRAQHMALMRDYGLSFEQYSKMVREQKCLCAICGKNKKLVVDHDHSTGAVRGLLCSNCNAGIGMLRESVSVLRSAISYLEGFKRSSQEPVSTEQEPVSTEQEPSVP